MIPRLLMNMQMSWGMKEEKQKIVFLEADKGMAIWSHQHQSGSTCWISGVWNLAPGQGEKQRAVGCALWACRNVLLLQDPRNWLSGWPVMLCFVVVGLCAFAFGSASIIQKTNKWCSQMPGVSSYSADLVLGSRQTLRKCLLSPLFRIHSTQWIVLSIPIVICSF